MPPRRPGILLAAETLYTVATNIDELFAEYKKRHLTSVQDLTQQFRNDALARNNAVLNELIAAYSKAYSAVEAEMVEYQNILNSDDALGTQILRLSRIQDRLATKLAFLAPYTDRKVQEAQGAALDQALIHSEALVMAQLSERLADNQQIDRAAVRRIMFDRFRSSWSPMPRDAFENIVGATADGSPVRRIIDNAARIRGGQMTDTLRAGLLTGRNPRDVALDLRKNLGADLSRALTIARTEYIRAYRHGTQQNYQRNSHIVDGWLWQAALDGRTCIGCIFRHGSRHPVTEMLSDHPNGRCAMVPVTRSFQQLGEQFGMPELGSVRERAPRRMQSGIEWFHQQDASLQAKILGPSRYMAFSQGKSFGSMVDIRHDPIWGETVGARSIRSMPDVQELKERSFQFLQRNREEIALIGGAALLVTAVTAGAVLLNPRLLRTLSRRALGPEGLADAEIRLFGRARFRGGEAGDPTGELEELLPNQPREPFPEFEAEGYFRPAIESPNAVRFRNATDALHAQRILEELYPDKSFDFSDWNDRSAREVAEAVDQLFQRDPVVAQRINFIGNMDHPEMSEYMSRMQINLPQGNVGFSTMVPDNRGWRGIGIQRSIMSQPYEDVVSFLNDHSPPASDYLVPAAFNRDGRWIVEHEWGHSRVGVAADFTLESLGVNPVQGTMGWVYSDTEASTDAYKRAFMQMANRIHQTTSRRLFPNADFSVLDADQNATGFDIVDNIHVLSRTRLELSNYGSYHWHEVFAESHAEVVGALVGGPDARLLARAYNKSIDDILREWGNEELAVIRAVGPTGRGPDPDLPFNFTPQGGEGPIPNPLTRGGVPGGIPPNIIIAQGVYVDMSGFNHEYGMRVFNTVGEIADTYGDETLMDVAFIGNERAARDLWGDIVPVRTSTDIATSWRARLNIQTKKILDKPAGISFNSNLFHGGPIFNEDGSRAANDLLDLIVADSERGHWPAGVTRETAIEYVTSHEMGHQLDYFLRSRTSGPSFARKLQDSLDEMLANTPTGIELGYRQPDGFYNRRIMDEVIRRELSYNATYRNDPELYELVADSLAEVHIAGLQGREPRPLAQSVVDLMRESLDEYRRNRPPQHER